MEETSEEAASRRSGMAMERLAGVVRALAKERHAAMMASGHQSHSYDFASCSDDVCMEAVRAHEEIAA